MYVWGKLFFQQEFALSSRFVVRNSPTATWEQLTVKNSVRFEKYWTELQQPFTAEDKDGPVLSDIIWTNSV